MNILFVYALPWHRSVRSMFSSFRVSRMLHEMVRFSFVFSLLFAWSCAAAVVVVAAAAVIVLLFFYFLVCCLAVATPSTTTTMTAVMFVVMVTAAATTTTACVYVVCLFMCLIKFPTKLSKPSRCARISSKLSIHNSIYCWWWQI